MSTLIKLRRDTAANWAAADPVLQLGEPGYDTTNNELRIGNGTDPWSELTPIAGGGGNAITQGGNSVQVNTDGTVSFPGSSKIDTATDGGTFTIYPNISDTDYSLQMFISYDNDVHIQSGNIDKGIALGKSYGSGAHVRIVGNVAYGGDTAGDICVQPQDYVGGTQQTFRFSPTGTFSPPVQTIARGDTSSGTINGFAMIIGDNSSEAIISTPNGDANGINSSQRLVINPGKGADGTSGEGGDIYLWAGRGGNAGGSGGDVKIRGGQGMLTGDGGYIRMEGGDGQGSGTAGYITMDGGQGIDNNGGYITLQGGYSQNAAGGYVELEGGYGANGDGGNVTLIGGGSNFGQSGYGNINIQSGSKYWEFDNTGNITIPAGGTIQTASGTNGDIVIHPDGEGDIVILGAANTKVFISSDVPDAENRIELDTYGANLGQYGGGVFVGTYRRTDGPSLVDDRFASFAGVGTENGTTIGNVCAKISIDAAQNWSLGNTPSHISFWTTPSGTNVPVEQMRLGPVGNLMVYNGNIVVSTGKVIAPLITTTSRTVSALPAANATPAGTRAFVTDADSRTFDAVVGGGAGNAMPVWCDGVDWRIG